MGIIVVGIVAGTLCTISFIPQVIKIYKTKDAKDLSLITFLIFACGVSLWLLYGILIKDLPIIIANILTLSLVVTILVLRIRYR